MNNLKKFIAWFFFAPNAERSVFQVIVWWEIRRIPYNLFIGFVGFISLILFFIFADATNKIPAGDDFVEPMAIFFAPFAINFCYTFGSIVEIIFGRIWKREDESLASRLLKFGVGVSLFIVLAPSGFWGIELLLLKLGLAK